MSGEAIREEWVSPDGRIRLLLGDCLAILPEMEAGSFDCLITSPPYNLGASPWPHLGNWKQGDSAGGKSKWRNGSDAASGIQYGEHVDAIPWPEYVAWQQEFLRVAWELLPGDGAIFYNHKPRVVGAKLWTPMELIPPNVAIRQIVIWSRPGGVNFNATAFVPTHEWIMVLARDLFRLKSRGVSGFGDVWSMAPEKNDHPAPFPTDLPSRILEAVKSRSILDPFMGSGTTAIACLRAGRSFVGIEKDERWFRYSVSRVRRELSQPLLPALRPAPEVQPELFP